MNAAVFLRKLPPIEEEDHRIQQQQQRQRKIMPSRGIGSCSGVDESIVRAFFASNAPGGGGVESDDDQQQQRSSSSSSFKGCGTPMRGPLGMLASFITCWKPMASSSSSSSSASSSCSSMSPIASKKKAWKTAALVELSKQQQAALADKQDAIDMLEWQLEQLQAAAGNIGSAAHEDEMAALDRCLKLALEHQKRDEDDLVKENRTPNSPNLSPPLAPLSPPMIPPLDCSEAAALVILFEMAVVRARLSIRQFCSLFLKQMEASGYPVVRLLAEMEPRATFTRKEHVAYVIDSRVNKAFFHCFESESYDEEGITSILDPSRRCASKLHEYRRMKCTDVSDAVDSKSPCFSPGFLKFCQIKTSEMWNEFGFSVAFRSAAERDTFTAAFLDVAKAAWLLHRLAFAMNPNVSIVRVARGAAATAAYVDPVVSLDRPCSKCCQGPSNVVEFMIMPGFRTPKKVIKCQVYPHVQCK